MSSFGWYTHVHTHGPHTRCIHTVKILNDKKRKAFWVAGVTYGDREAKEPLFFQVQVSAKRWGFDEST